jgi:hypothetical protein
LLEACSGGGKSVHMRSMDKGIAGTGKRARRQLVQEEEEDVQEADTIGKSGKWSIFILKLVGISAPIRL